MNTHTKRIIAGFFLLIACYSVFYAQGSALLEAYVQEGLTNNLGIRQMNLEVQKDQELLRQSKAMSRLKLTFDANYTLAAGGRKLDFPIGDLLNPVYATLNQITSSNAFPQVENAEIQFLPNNFHETKFSAAYPLYNSDLRYLRQIQGDQLTGKNALLGARELALRYDIIQAYLQYLQAIEAEQVWQNARKVVAELRRFNESLVKNNVATIDIVATADYELAKVDQEIFNWQSKQNSARAFFNYLIQADLQRPVQVDSVALRAMVPNYDLNVLLQGFETRRREPEAVQSMISASSTNARRNEANQKLPDLYVGGSVGFQGFGYQFNSEQAYVLAQIGLSYPIYDGGLNRSKTQESRLDVQLAKNQLDNLKSQIALEITSAWNNLESARFALQTAQKNVASAESILKIVQNKYKAGQSLLLELLDAQNRTTTAQLQFRIARVDLLIKEAALKKAAGLQ